MTLTAFRNPADLAKWFTSLTLIKMYHEKPVKMAQLNDDLKKIITHKDNSQLIEFDISLN